ncbi:cytoplasmic protein [Cryptococcus neoformans]|nr:cytoplasmic protein [Cryptococcus neoformans var. grubii 125.91]OXG27010.1 cytoplasmic protein [Cryptococcus neoformans var. grubii Bt15]OXG43881.1 cytoplasmic protein [Cryptococcus neoformans var. grubii Th84]OXG72687.1 cytoplasmic protein [Cryptococcus neoformans var. grubii MW-RSA36]OXH01141.1 cytoplasmic protein [Cryptococcus neoformans var. grubii]OXL05619.1 cytoplasmic protein [Cryptococcus neoformans var. grubii Gb118]
MTAFPSLAAVFLTYFDDIKGQSVLYYSSLPDIPEGTIEHATLPSGLHNLSEDLICFRHHGRPGVGLFRSREKPEGENRGRGRTMGVVGVVLEEEDVTNLYSSKSALEEIYDKLENLSQSPFISSAEQDGERDKVLDEVWETYRADKVRKLETAIDEGKENELDRVHKLITERGRVPAVHPIAFMPLLLGILGPNIVPVYKAALSGQHILLYSQPPILPLSALAWNIWALSLPPRAALANGEAEISEWLGNVGLMDLDNVKAKKGGWVATTSDMIFKSHTKLYDIFIDLSSNPLPPTPVSSPSSFTSPSPIILSTSTSPSSSSATPLTYTLPSLPLYRSLLLLTSSPPTIHAGMWKEGGWWLVIYELLEKVWKVCVGVCEFAAGRGNIGMQGGGVRLQDGEEEEQLLDNAGEDDLLDLLEEAGDEAATVQGDSAPEPEEDEAVRQGRLILRQLFHHTYHLHSHLLSVLNGRPRGERSMGQLSDLEVKTLSGRWAGAQDAMFWRGVARRWGSIVDLDEE